MAWPKTNFRLVNTRTTTALPSPDDALAGVTPDSRRCSCGVALESRLGQACNEEAFRHFLAIERKRSRRSGRPFLLLLVGLKKRRRFAGRVDAAVAAKLFACLWLSLRESDVVGWFREGRVAGALLTQHGEAAATNVADLVCDKVRRSLQESLPSELVRHLDVRAFRLPSRRKDLN
jgi:hypothetical protein